MSQELPAFNPRTELRLAEEQWQTTRVLADRIIAQLGNDHSLDDAYLIEAEWMTTDLSATCSLQLEKQQNGEAYFGLEIAPFDTDVDVTQYQFSIEDHTTWYAVGDDEYTAYSPTEEPLVWLAIEENIADYLRQAPVDKHLLDEDGSDYIAFNSIVTNLLAERLADMLHGYHLHIKPRTIDTKLRELAKRYDLSAAFGKITYDAYMRRAEENL